MTAPDQPESPFMALARKLAAASSDEEAVAMFQQETGLTGDPNADREEMARRATVRARGGAKWDCVAYGPELGMMCFFAMAEDPCTSQPQCKSRMVAERQLVFRRINELAASGDETGIFLAGEFTDPGQILNAGPDDQAGNQ